ncbi:MAG TPA: proline dehydrogenase family protein [Longimicrobiales bacterium]|nr:proline dehydrogenase family protein [Longimicrobiales bacterium]
MRPVRSVLLRASTSPWLARRLPRWYFTRRAVRRFMPGEDLEDALSAVASLRDDGFPAVITQLGENVDDEQAVNVVVGHYLAALDRVRDEGHDCHVSVKPTHLGLDLSSELCLDAHRRLAARAANHGNVLWIDMESSLYTDATISLFRSLRRDFGNIGLCLQANLRRTESDLARLLPLAPSIRLVKGAYAEPSDVAFRRKRDVDAAYLRLAQHLLRHDYDEGDAIIGVATHDVALIQQVAASARSHGRGADDFEVQMLYGIRSGVQRQLADEGFRVRVLISYGDHWFPWYMRRLAERPANVWFVARSVFAH